MANHRFVIDEWLLEDLAGTNDPSAQKETFAWVKTFAQQKDKILVLRESKWMKKAWNLMKSEDYIVSQISKYIHMTIINDSEKCSILENQECSDPPPRWIQDVKDDDQYLLITYFNGSADLLTTSDHPLFNALSTIPEIQVKMRDPFLAEYPSVCR